MIFSKITQEYKAYAKIQGYTEDWGGIFTASFC